VKQGHGILQQIIHEEHKGGSGPTSSHNWQAEQVVRPARESSPEMMKNYKHLQPKTGLLISKRVKKGPPIAERKKKTRNNDLIDIQGLTNDSLTHSEENIPILTAVVREFCTTSLAT